MGINRRYTVIMLCLPVGNPSSPAFNYFALNSGGTVAAASKDGITWVTCSGWPGLPVGDQIRIAKYAFGQFWVWTSAHAIHSADLINWTTDAYTNQPGPGPVINGQQNNTAVSPMAAVSPTSSGPSTANVSTDGINFSSVNINNPGAASYPEFCVFSGSFFVAIQHTDHINSLPTYKSSDNTGSSWACTVFIDTVSLAILGLAYNGSFCAVDASGKSVTSSDGSTWSQNTMTGSPPSSLTGMCGKSGTFLGLSASSSYTSSDGIAWSSHSVSGSSNLVNPIYDGSMFLCVDTTVDTAFYSTDGATWSSSSLPASGGYTYIVSNKGVN